MVSSVAIFLSLLILVVSEAVIAESQPASKSFEDSLLRLSSLKSSRQRQTRGKRLPSPDYSRAPECKSPCENAVMSNESCGTDSRCLCDEKLIDSLVKCLDCVGTREVQDKEKAQKYLDSYVVECLVNDVPAGHRTIHVTGMESHHTSTSTPCTTTTTRSETSTSCTTTSTPKHTKAEYPMYPASSITMYSGTPTAGDEQPTSTDAPDKSEGAGEGGESGSQTETAASGESSAISEASSPVSSDGSSVTGSTDVTGTGSPLASSTSAPPSDDPGNPNSEAAQGNGALSFSMHPIMGIRIAVALLVVGMSLLMFGVFFGL
ncbi:hypothetical protein PM082_012255 [Marasmius tenuissimus]|nr:hypothetical protein PM082_012255 [Marasmius tenuissimus]